MEKSILKQFAAIITLLRPQQWLKNSFIFLPLFFDHKLLDLKALLAAVIAFFAYSFAASGIYCMNDIIDVEADKKHPKKCKRPIINRRNKILQIFLLWFLIDITILFVSGYGLCQAEIFCGHWFFIIPILISCSFSLFKHKTKYLFYCTISIFTLFFLIHNTSMIINSLNTI